MVGKRLGISTENWRKDKNETLNILGSRMSDPGI
jgi:hypothetical protein